MNMRNTYVVGIKYGGKVGAGHFEGTQPTYVFPVAIKEVVRARFPEEQDTVPKTDPEGSMVHNDNSIYYNRTVLIHACVQIL